MFLHLIIFVLSIMNVTQVSETSRDEILFVGSVMCAQTQDLLL